MTVSLYENDSAECQSKYTEMLLKHGQNAGSSRDYLSSLLLTRGEFVTNLYIQTSLTKKLVPLLARIRTKGEIS